jgi:polyhydroxyalkanoate synthesis regulator protein
MTEKKKDSKGFSTCLENARFAEMLQKMMGQQGIGSLCAEMLKKAGHEDADGCIARCTEMMQTMMKGFTGTKQKPKETKKEADHVGDE